VQPLVHCLLHLFVGPERLASHRLFEWSKNVEITWGEVWWMWKTLEGHLGLLQQLVSMGPSIVMLQQNTCTQKSTSFGLDCRTQVILEICILCTGRSVPPGHVVLRNYITPRASQKRVSITFPADGCVRNFFRFGEEVWRHSLLAFLVSGW